jgi:hypothetical protein
VSSVVNGRVLDLTRKPWEAKFRTVRAIGTAQVPDAPLVLVVADPDRPGQNIAHRGGRFSDEPAQCGAGHGFLAPADAYDGCWCHDDRCDTFRWWGAR